MAITIDQFLRDLNERQALSGAELSAVRLELAHSDPAASANKSVAARNGNSAASATKTPPSSNSSPLVLCDCVIKEKLRGDENHWVFSAAKLEDNTPATIHVLMPNASHGSNGVYSGGNGVPEDSSTPTRIADVGRHGEMVCLCCESIDAETLKELVAQHQGLPLDLATETLLDVVETLRAFQTRGLELDRVSAGQLLLDEDGRTHLSGHDPGALKMAARNDPGEPTGPSVRLLASLGELFQFLQTGGADASATLDASAQIVCHRLLQSDAPSGYRVWDELLTDLKALRDGREIAQTAQSDGAASTRNQATKSGSNTFGLLVGLAIVIAAAFAAWAVFGQ